MDSAEKPLYVRRAEAALYHLQESERQGDIQKAGPAAVTYALLAIWEEMKAPLPITSTKRVDIREPTRDYFKGE